MNYEPDERLAPSPFSFSEFWTRSGCQPSRCFGSSRTREWLFFLNLLSRHAQFSVLYLLRWACDSKLKERKDVETSGCELHDRSSLSVSTWQELDFSFLFSLTCPDYFLFLCIYMPGIVREREKEKELSSCPFFLSGLPHYVQASRYAGKEKGFLSLPQNVGSTPRSGCACACSGGKRKKERRLRLQFH